jgi:glutathione S-transferase
MSSASLLPASRLIAKALFTGKGKDQAMEKLEDLKTLCKTLNTHIENKSFFVGESVTHADIALFCGLLLPMSTCFNKGYRENGIPNLNKWFNTLAEHEAFVRHAGHVKACGAKSLL